MGVALLSFGRVAHQSRVDLAVSAKGPNVTQAETALKLLNDETHSRYKPEDINAVISRQGSTAFSIRKSWSTHVNDTELLTTALMP